MKALFIGEKDYIGYSTFSVLLEDMDISADFKDFETVVVEDVEDLLDNFQIVFIHSVPLSARSVQILRFLRSKDRRLPIVYVCNDKRESTGYLEAMEHADGVLDEKSSPAFAARLVKRVLSGTAFFKVHGEVVSLLEDCCEESDLSHRNYGSVFKNRLSYVRFMDMMAGSAISEQGETFHHMARVGVFSKMIADSMGLEESFCKVLEFAAPLHDLGMTGVPEEVIQKKNGLSFSDWSNIRLHGQIGENLLGTAMCPVLKMARVIVRTHHERWDGEGYTSGISSGNIPTAGLITALADSFDVMVSSRPYKKEIMIEEAFENVKLNSGSQFCPMCVYSLLSRKDEIREFYMKSFGMIEAIKRQ